MTIKDIKKKSKADLKNNYGISILTMILLSLVAFGSAAVGFIVGAVIVAGAVTCCYAAFYVDIAKHQIKSVDSTYRGFRQFARALKVMLIYAAVILGALIACALLSWFWGTSGVAAASPGSVLSSGLFSMISGSWAMVS